MQVLSDSAEVVHGFPEHFVLFLELHEEAGPLAYFVEAFVEVKWTRSLQCVLVFNQTGEGVDQYRVQFLVFVHVDTDQIQFRVEQAGGSWFGDDRAPIQQT